MGSLCTLVTVASMLPVVGALVLEVVSGRHKATSWALAFLLFLVVVAGAAVAAGPEVLADPALALKVLAPLVPAVWMWGWLARWSSTEAPAPVFENERLSWAPRPSHRTTWVVLVGVLGVLAPIAGFVVDVWLAALLGAGLLGAWGWAHLGQRGALRLEGNELCFGPRRIELRRVDHVDREVRFLGPIRRERLVIGCQGATPFRLLITGSPDADVEAVVGLLRAGYSACRGS